MQWQSEPAPELYCPGRIQLWLGNEKTSVSHDDHKRDYLSQATSYCTSFKACAVSLNLAAKPNEPQSHTQER